MASPAIQLATAYVSLVVSTQGVGKDVARELGAVEKHAQSAGQSAGQKLAAAFNKSKIDTRASQEQVKRLEETVKRASKAVSQSREKEEDATRKVAIAQKSYEEAVARTGSSSSRALAAQDRLIVAQRKAEGAAHQTAAALDAEERAMKELGDETNKTEGKVKGFGAKFKSAVSGGMSNLNPFSKMKGHAEKAGKESADGFSAKVKGGLGGFAGSVGKLLGPLAALGGVAALGGGLKDSINAAGQLEQSVGAIQSIFKGSSDQMLSWSEQADTAVGLTKNEFNELGTLIGAQLKNGGTAMEELAPKTNDLIGLGADLSSMFGGTTKDAVGALSSALKGERDPIEKYGVSLKQAQIDAKAAELGFEKVNGSLSNEASQAATLALIMEQTTDAHGNFAKESDTYAHKVQVLSAKFEDMKTGLGERLLPIATQVLDWVEKIGPKFEWVSQGLTGVSDILFKGEFNGNVFGLEEDDPIIGILFDIRDTALELMGVGDILFKGDFGGPLFGLEEDDPIIGILFSVRETAIEVFDSLVGAGEKISEVWDKNVAPIVTAVWDTITGAISDNGPMIEGVLGKVSDAFGKIGTIAGDIGALISHVWEAIGPTVLPIVEGFIGAIVGIFDGLWTTVNGIMDLISAMLSGDWSAASEAVKTIVDGMGNAIGSAFTWLFESVGSIVMLAWDRIVEYFNQGKDLVIRKATDLKDGVVRSFTKAKDDAVRQVTQMKDLVVNKVTELKDGVSTTFTRMWDGVKTAFRTGVDAVEDIFGGIRDAAKNPVKFVIETVINDGIIKGVNTLADKVGLGKPLNRIALPAGFARGGILSGTSSWRDGDDQIIRARRGEGIIVSEALQDPYERKRLHAINAAAIKGIPLDTVREHFDGFATGGIVGYHGVRMDAASAQLLLAAEELFGGPFNPTQGSYRPRTSYSGGTHMGAGAVDVTQTSPKAVASMRRVGAAAWDRTGKGNWRPHTHAIFPVPGLSASAAQQMASFHRGGDGLGGRDSGPRVDVVGGLANLAGKAWDLFSRAGESVLNFVEKPLQMFNDAVGGGMNLIDKIPGGGIFKDVLTKIPSLVVDGIKDWFSDKVGIPKFANGGYTPGGVVSVGERGPELVHLPRGSYVQPNHHLPDSQRMGSMVEIKVVDERFRGLVRAEVRQMKKEGAF